VACGIRRPPPSPRRRRRQRLLACPDGGSKPVPGLPRPNAMRESPNLDPDFLEHLHREAQGEQLELLWD